MTVGTLRNRLIYYSPDMEIVCIDVDSGQGFSVEAEHISVDSEKTVYLYVEKEKKENEKA
jgi:hypothetical protein